MDFMIVFSRFLFSFISTKKIHVCQTLNTAYLATVLNTSKFIKKTLLHVVFSTLFSVFGKVVKHSFFVFDILCLKTHVCI